MNFVIGKKYILRNGLIATHTSNTSNSVTLCFLVNRATLYTTLHGLCINNSNYDVIEECVDTLAVNVHKRAKFIKAFAYGAAVQFFDEHTGYWIDITKFAKFDGELTNLRLKPAEINVGDKVSIRLVLSKQIWTVLAIFEFDKRKRCVLSNTKTFYIDDIDSLTKEEK